MNINRKPAAHLLLILVLGLLVYSNTFHSPFQWDESDYIVGNPIIKSLGYFAEPSRAKGFPVYNGLKSRYIGYLTFALNYRIHGFDVVGYHIVNLAIHIFNAILVYFLLLLTFKTTYFRRETSDVKSKELENQRRELQNHSRLTIDDSRFTYYIALAVALLFVAHPLQTEAVTYVFQRFASLVAMFFLLSLVLYIKGSLSAKSDRQKTVSLTAAENSLFTIHASRFTIIWYLLSLISAVLAMRTKENAITLPVVITLYELLFFRRPLKSRLFRLAPFLLTMLIIPLTIIGLGSTAGDMISEIKDPEALGLQTVSGDKYLFTQFRVIVTYLRLLILPVSQNLVYDYPVFHSFFAPPVFISFLLLSAIFGSAVWLLYKSGHAGRLVERGSVTVHASRGSEYSLFTIHYSRLIAFGIIWFFITLAVESSILPLPMLIDEYRVYLPSVGFFIAVTAGAALLIERFTGAPARKLKMAAALLSVIVLGLSSATYARNVLWTDKVSLWEDVIRKSPSSPRAYNNLGLAFKEKGLREKAIEMYGRAIILDPRFSLAYSNLGVAYADAGLTARAIENFEKAVSLNPKNLLAYANMARAYGEAGRLDKAVENYGKVIALKPYDSAAYHGLGTAYVMLGRLDDALAAYTRFVALSPDDPEAYRSRGIVYAKKGDARNAGSDFQKACTLGSNEGCEYLKSGRFQW